MNRLNDTLIGTTFMTSASSSPNKAALATKLKLDNAMTKVNLNVD
jgi:hypothetical protein